MTPAGSAGAGRVPLYRTSRRTLPESIQISNASARLKAEGG